MAAVLVDNNSPEGRELNEKYLLICGIGLRRWELLGKYDNDSSDLVRQLLSEIKPNDIVYDDGVTKSTIKNLVSLLYQYNTTDEPLEKGMFLQTMRTVLSAEDNETFNAIEYAVSTDRTDEEIIEYCRQCQDNISKFFEYKKFYKEVGKYTQSIRSGRITGKVKDIATELIDMLQPYSNTGTADGGIGVNNPVVVDGLASGNNDLFTKAWNKTMEKSSPRGLLKTGFKALNRGLGGGIPRGDCIVTPALQHNYKSGTIHEIIAGVMHFNIPMMKDESCTPAILHISFENDITDDLHRIYRKCYYETYGECQSIEDTMNTNPKQAQQVIDKYLEVNGYKYLYVRVDPTDFGYRDVYRLINEFITQKYEIHLLAIDYLSMINTKGLPQRKDGTEYQELFKYIRNYCSVRDIAFITPHQLSTEATYLNRDDLPGWFVDKVAGKSYYSKSKQIDREVDIEIVQHIERLELPDREKNDGSTIIKSYLTQRVGKNRRNHSVPEAHKAWAIPFNEYGLKFDEGTDEDHSITLKELRQISTGMNINDNDVFGYN